MTLPKPTGTTTTMMDELLMTKIASPIPKTRRSCSRGGINQNCPLIAPLSPLKQRHPSLVYFLNTIDEELLHDTAISCSEVMLTNMKNIENNNSSNNNDDSVRNLDDSSSGLISLSWMDINCALNSPFDGSFMNHDSSKDLSSGDVYKLHVSTGNNTNNSSSSLSKQQEASISSSSGSFVSLPSPFVYDALFDASVSGSNSCSTFDVHEYSSTTEGDDASCSHEGGESGAIVECKSPKDNRIVKYDLNKILHILDLLEERIGEQLSPCKKKVRFGNVEVIEYTSPSFPIKEDQPPSFNKSGRYKRNELTVRENCNSSNINETMKMEGMNLNDLVKHHRTKAKPTLASFPCVEL